MRKHRNAELKAFFYPKLDYIDSATKYVESINRIGIRVGKKNKNNEKGRGKEMKKN